jgi:hypothetical protein
MKDGLGRAGKERERIIMEMEDLGIREYAEGLRGMGICYNEIAMNITAIKKYPVGAETIEQAFKGGWKHRRLGGRRRDPEYKGAVTDIVGRVPRKKAYWRPPKKEKPKHTASRGFMAI